MMLLFSPAVTRHEGVHDEISIGHDRVQSVPKALLVDGDDDIPPLDQTQPVSEMMLKLVAQDFAELFRRPDLIVGLEEKGGARHLDVPTELNLQELGEGQDVGHEHDHQSGEAPRQIATDDLEFFGHAVDLVVFDEDEHQSVEKVNVAQRLGGIAVLHGHDLRASREKIVENMN